MLTVRNWIVPLSRAMAIVSPSGVRAMLWIGCRKVFLGDRFQADKISQAGDGFLAEPVDVLVGRIELERLLEPVEDLCPVAHAAGAAERSRFLDAGVIQVGHRLLAFCLGYPWAWVALACSATSSWFCASTLARSSISLALALFRESAMRTLGVGSCLHGQYSRQPHHPGKHGRRDTGDPGTVPRQPADQGAGPGLASMAFLRLSPLIKRIA